MPGSDGKLSAAEKQKFIDWINSKAKNHACPVCHSNQWTVGDDLLNGLIFTPGAFVLGGPAYPMVFLTCNTCAYTRHFMAIPIGILAPDPAPKQTEGERSV